MSVHLKTCRISGEHKGIECSKCSGLICELGCYVKGNGGYESYCIKHYREMAVKRGWNPRVSRCCNQFTEDFKLWIDRYNIDKDKTEAVLLDFVGAPDNASDNVSDDASEDVPGDMLGDMPGDDSDASSYMAKLKQCMVTPDEFRRITERNGSEYVEYDEAFPNLSRGEMLARIKKYYPGTRRITVPLNHAYVLGRYIIDLGFIKDVHKCVRALSSVQMTCSTARMYVNYAKLCDDFPIMKYLDTTLSKIRKRYGLIRQYLRVHWTNDEWSGAARRAEFSDDEPPRKKPRKE